MRRRTFLTAGLVCAAGTSAYGWLAEPRWLDVTRTPVRIPSPTAGRLRLLHLSDIHASRWVPLSILDEAVTYGLQQRPDLVCITGDWITDHEVVDRAEYVRILRRLSAVAPVYGVLGNHDGGAWTSIRGGLETHAYVDLLLADSGITLLHNRTTRLHFGDLKLNLAGVGDLWSGELDAASTFLDTVPNAPTILMAHNPDSKTALADSPWDLMLSGHTHGGQVIIPFDGPRFAPVVDRRYIAGLGQWDNRQIFVTRGIGGYAGFRFRCRPEVSLLDITFAWPNAT